MWKNIVIPFFALFILFLSSPALAEDKSFCNDPEAEAGWQKLLRKYPGDKDVNILHALRLGLCEKVDMDQHTVKEASTIFESARMTLIEDIQQRRQDQDEMSQKEMNKLSIMLALLKNSF